MGNMVGKSKGRLGFVLAVLVLTVCIGGTLDPALAITFTATDGGLLSASAAFTLSSGTLTVVLTNTGGEVSNPSQILTALFFSSSGTLTPVSATLSGGSTVFFGPDGGGNVGGEWAYGSSLAGAPLGATQGISSSGFSLFGAANFGGANLEGPIAVNGMNYGLVSGADDLTLGNAAVTGGFPLIQNQVTFTLTAGGAFTLASLSNVSFQYGTALTEPNIHNGQLPEPASLLLLGFGLIVLGIWKNRQITLSWLPRLGRKG